MPHPQHDRVNCPRRQSARRKEPDRAYGLRARKRSDTAPDRLRERPQERNERPSEHEKRRGNGHQQLVLEHMNGEQRLAERVYRWHQGRGENQPAGDKAGNLAMSKAAIGRGGPPEPPHASQVKPQRYAQNGRYGPFGAPQPYLVPGGMMRQGGMRPEKDRGREDNGARQRWHGSK